MEVKHVKGCEYNRSDYIGDCEEEVKRITEKLIMERKANFHEHDNYSYNSSMNICPNVYCNIYSDLYNWFGFKNCTKIDTESLKTCFTDITNGGIGYYEKLIVLGGKILELYSELHFYNKYNSEKEEIVADLKNLKNIKEIVYHYLYVQKRKNRVIFKNSLYLFGYSYLYTPLFFNNKNSIIKYVKACIAYAVKFNKSNIFSWMPSLIEHIYYSQKIKVSEIEAENELLQDLQEYFGYSFDYILPRINECFSSHNLYISNSHLTGLQIIRIFANEYFSHLADDMGFYGKEKVLWVKEETDAFLESKCIEIFSGCLMAIKKHLNEQDVKISKVRHTFEMIISSCWVLGEEKKNKIWMSALIQRLRQIQLLTQITTIEKWAYSIKKYNDINVSNFVNDIYNFNNINGSILSPFQLQNVNMLMPASENETNGIPYYTTLADRYKNRCDRLQNGKMNNSNHKEENNANAENIFSNVLNNLSEKFSKHFKSRTKKPTTSMVVKQSINPNVPNFQIDKQFRLKKKHMSSEIYNLKENENEENEEEEDTEEGTEEDTEEGTEEDTEEDTEKDTEEDTEKDTEEEGEYDDEVITKSSKAMTKMKQTKHNRIDYKNLNTRNTNAKRNGIPIKVKYVKDSDDDENSKYIIEIPKKNLKGKSSKNHIKAVLWGNSKKGLEINIPTVKNKLPQMKIQ